VLFWPCQDAPFIHTDSFLMIHRSGRKCWYVSTWLYIVMQAAVYYECSLVLTALCIFPKAYFHNIWSRALTNYADSITMRNGITVPFGAQMTDYTPYTAICHTFLLVLLYSILLASILYALNLYVHTEQLERL
ncbi:MAG: hypothetical protein V8R80_11295, partial [Eubacterium sp.]